MQSANQAGGPTSVQESDDGSSLLIPILVAILALAAISVAIVMMRAKRQRGTGAAASPKAS